jgi:hypothetical protein
MTTGFKVTIYGTDSNIATPTVVKTTLDALSDKVVTTFDVEGLYMRQIEDIEIMKNLNGRQIKTKNVSYESYTIALQYQSFKSQTSSPTFEANRFNYDLLKKKYHFLFFHNASGIYDYPYLSEFLNSTTVLTHGLQVIFLGKGTVEQSTNLNKWNLDFETAFALT